MRGNRREIVGVDQEMNDARMVRLRGGDLLQDARALQLLGMGLIVAIRRDLQPVRIENRRFGILGIARVELLQRLLVGRCARLERHRRVILEDGLDGGDVIALARRLAAELFRLFDCGPAFLLQFRRRRRAERIVEARDGLAQYAIAQAGSACSTAATAASTFPVEGVQERGGRVEPRLCLALHETGKFTSPSAPPSCDGPAPEERRAARRE